jgi:hypothetical protein
MVDAAFVKACTAAAFCASKRFQAFQLATLQKGSSRMQPSTAVVCSEGLQVALNYNKE